MAALSAGRESSEALVCAAWTAAAASHRARCGSQGRGIQVGAIPSFLSPQAP